jgi:hypothetical protein
MIKIVCTSFQRSYELEYILGFINLSLRVSIESFPSKKILTIILLLVEKGQLKRDGNTASAMTSVTMPSLSRAAVTRGSR